MSDESIFGEVIYSYSRKQAIEDGLLFDCTQLASEAGFKIPVALTQHAWSDVQEVPIMSCQDVEGRLWDVLWMASFEARRNRSQSEFEFKVSLQTDRAPRTKTLVCHCGPGDDAEPVITIGYREDF
jgi:hypothetical protein